MTKKTETKKAAKKTIKIELTSYKAMADTRLVATALFLSKADFAALRNATPLNIYSTSKTVVLEERPATFAALGKSLDLDLVRKILVKASKAKKGDIALFPHASMGKRLEAGKGKCLSFSIRTTDLKI